MEYPSETRVLWPLQVRIYLTYRNEDISQLKRTLSEKFEVGNKGKQGCVLAPNTVPVFSFFYFYGHLWCYHWFLWKRMDTGANLFNANKFKSARKTRNILVHELIFTEDTAFVAQNYQDSQKIITRFSKSAKTSWLKINLKKTKVIYQHRSRTYDNGQDIQIGDQVLIHANKFRYLGSTVTINNRQDEVLNTWASNASKAFGGRENETDSTKTSS